MTAIRGTVAVIGAGCSGLTAAKALLEVGLEPHIFEQSHLLGGIWSTNPPFSWPSMRSNVSKHSCNFSDFPYPDQTTSTYPRVNQFAEYINAYAAKFGSSERISRGHRVTSVKREHGNGKWNVCWQEVSKKTFGSRLFDFVIVASGHYSQPIVPDIQGLETFPDEKVIHSSRYTNPSAFKGKRIAVIGSGFSGVEIAADLSIHAEVFHVFPRPSYVLPRHLPLLNNDGPPLFLPLDLAFNRRTGRASLYEVSPSNTELFAKSHERMRAFVGDQANIHPALHIQEVDKPVMISVSDHYAELVRSRKINIVKGKLTSVEGTTLKIDSGTKIPDVDYIILSTGYRPSLSSFLDPDDLKTFSYQPENPIVPLLLYRNMIHPDVPHFAFVGMYRGPYWGVMELQARYVAALFSERLPIPPDFTLHDGINKERALRNFHPPLQFSHNDYVGLISSLARDLGIPTLIDSKWPTAVNEIVIPAQFASPSVTSPRNSSWDIASTILLESLTTTIRSAESGTRYIAPAVFRALHGRWKLERRITSKLQTLPSGVFTGSAIFTPRLSADNDISMSSDIDEYLYEEEGTLRLEATSVDLQARRSYIYRLIEEQTALEAGTTSAVGAVGETHRIDVFFTRSSGDGAVDNFFHSIRFVEQGTSCTAATIEQDKKKKKTVWKAEGQHLCIDDMYKSEYWFHFEGVQISRFGFAFDVQGPKKDYRAVSEFVR